ncbi:MAG: hypothetical protein OGMRLDGQ_000383 [Candidatus Fervidibacter sp.]
MEGCSPEQPNLPFLEGNAPALPKNWRARLLPCRTYRQIVKLANQQVEKLWSLEGCAPAQPPKIFRSCRNTTLQLNPKTAANGDWRIANGERKTSTRNAQPATQFYALRITLYAFNPQLTTRNPQPSTHFGANAPPTCHFYALRITLYASNQFRG